MTDDNLDDVQPEKKMSMKELMLEDSYGRKLHVTTFAGIIVITPIVEIVGDAIAISDHQANLLKLYLEEHLK